MISQGISTISNADLNYEELNRDFDRIKSSVFLSKDAAFIGALMCSLDFIWTSDIPTAGTNGISIQINPYFYNTLPKKTKEFLVMHELWHVALLHMLRRGNRHPKAWNWACDIFINNMLHLQGYTWEGLTFKPWFDLKYANNSSEEIYDILFKDKINDPEISFPLGNDEGDLIEPEEEQEASDGTSNGEYSDIKYQIINGVVGAATSAGMTGEPGSVPGVVQTILKRFLNPKLPWNVLLHQFFNSLGDMDYSWKRPNRRYSDMYLPSMEDKEGLDQVNYYLDVSGSVSDAEVVRFNSEVKFIKDTFNPKTLNLIQFDTKIQQEKTFTEDEPFEEIVIIGRGGTSLHCVREHIIKSKPTVVVIFSDLGCDPMEPLPIDIPTIWVAVNTTVNEVPFGKIIHIRE